MFTYQYKNRDVVLDIERKRRENMSNTKPKLFQKNYIILLIANFLIYSGFAMVTTTISVYIEQCGISAALSGTIIGVFATAALISRPFVGWLCDSTNRKRLFIIAIIIYAVSTLGYAFSTVAPVFLIFRITHGVSFGIVTTLTMTMLASFVPKERRGEGMAIVTMSNSVAFAITPSLAISIGNMLGYRYIYVVAAIILLTAGVFVSLLPYKHEIIKRKFEFHWGDFIAKDAIIFAVIMFAFSAVSCLSNSYIALYGANFNIQNIGWYFTIASVCTFISQYSAGKILDKLGFKWAFVPCTILTILSLLTLKFIQPGMAVPMFAIAGILLTLGNGGMNPVLQACSLNAVSEEKWGAASSTFYIGTDIGQAVGPMLGGAIAQSAGYGNMYASFIIPVAIVTILFFIAQRKNNQKR